MDFELTEEQKILKSSVRNFLERNCPASLVREMMKDGVDLPVQLWKGICELGWTALVLPGEYGGAGKSIVDLGVMLEEMGRVCLPAPFFTAVCGGLAVLEGGTDKQRQALLPKVAGGKTILSVALSEIPGQLDVASIMASAGRTTSGYVLSGSKVPVPDAHIASGIICPARTGEQDKNISLFLVNPAQAGVACVPLATISGEKRFRVTMDQVHVSEDGVLGAINGGSDVLTKVLPKIVVSKCMEMLGGMAKVLEMTVAYSKERTQGGHLIGAYQAIQHACADLLLEVDSARLLAYKAAWMAGHGSDCETEVAMAKGYIGGAYRHVTLQAHQIHGAIAFCEDYPMHLYLRRAKEAEEFLGDGDWHLEMVARGIGL